MKHTILALLFGAAAVSGNFQLLTPDEGLDSNEFPLVPPEQKSGQSAGTDLYVDGSCNGFKFA